MTEHVLHLIQNTNHSNGRLRRDENHMLFHWQRVDILPEAFPEHPNTMRAKYIEYGRNSLNLSIGFDQTKLVIAIVPDSDQIGFCFWR